MKILIGTPIHVSKDYSMERWLENVHHVQKHTAADVLLVDNSPGLDYVDRVTTLCTKYNIKNYTVEHFEVTNRELNPDMARGINVEISQEMIRQWTLKKDYDAWFSWECDQIIPADSLSRLTELMSSANYMMVVVNSWARSTPDVLNANMGVTLIGRNALKKGWFLPFNEGEVSTNLEDFYNVDETMFKKRVLKSGGNYVELYGVIEPIYHLNT
jgi:hypothetical protein